MKTKLLICKVILCLLIYRTGAQTVSLTPYASNLGYAIDIRHCNDDRLFVADRYGRIRVVNADATVRSTPFLDITGRISSTQSEEGFLGFCFSPNYKSDGKFYVCYTANINSQLHTLVEEYKVSATDSNLANPSSALTIIAVQQPFQNHKGGGIMFGNDGYLYVPLGDGGSGGDPYNNAQNGAVLLGKILRLDVSNSTLAQPYAIPPDNPFANAGGNIRKEIWANGLRNPWRTSFDRITHDMWIADVGQDSREEINFQAAASNGGTNYGWKVAEGAACYSPSSGCNVSGLLGPIYDYDHSVGRSVTGGYVYRSVQSRDLWGLYIYSDFTGRWIDGLRHNNGALSGPVIRLLSNAGGGPISFGEDNYGDVYVCLNNNGTIYKLEDANPNRFPKAYMIATLTLGGYQLKALEGRNITYQWLLNNNLINGANSQELMPVQNGLYQLVVTNAAGNKDTSEAFLVSAVLPVTIKEFKAETIRPELIRVSWITSTEQNNKGFTLERKLQHETTFQSIALIPSKALNGNSVAELIYDYDDVGQFTGTIQYRLKQSDNAGRPTYSPVVSINAGRSKLVIRIMPNPSRGWVHITTNHDNRYSYQVTDVSGKLILRSAFKGTNHEFSLKSVRNGIYHLKVQSAETKQSVVQTIIIRNE